MAKKSLKRPVKPKKATKKGWFEYCVAELDWKLANGEISGEEWVNRFFGILQLLKGQK